MPKELAAMVLARATGPDGVMRCDRCADPINSYLGFSRQHRRAFGAGGRSGAELHTPANVIVLCGSATSPGGCHNLVENTGPGRREAYDLGFAIKGEAIDPAAHPMLRHLVEWVIPGDGLWIPADPLAA